MIFAAIVLAAVASQPSAAAPDHTLLEILDAIRVVETRGTPNSGRDSGGDGGRAIGPFQIHYEYWKDAGLPGVYADCRDIDYARRVVVAYWQRYCPDAVIARDAETLARTHNGGPAGAKRASTLPFWKKVQHELDRPRGADRSMAFDVRNPRESAESARGPSTRAVHDHALA